MNAIEGGLIVAVLACWWFGRVCLHRAAYETAMGNLLRPAAELHGWNRTGDQLHDAVYRHYNIAASCRVIARFCAVCAWVLAGALIWRVVGW